MFLYDENDPLERRFAEIINATNFLNDLVHDDEITDIKYNGTKLLYKHNKKGLQVASYQPEEKEIEQFIKQVTNEVGKEFTNSTPLLNTSIGFLRISAVHKVHSPFGVSLSIRIARPRLVSSIQEMFKVDTYKEELEQLLSLCMQAELNTIISGRTGTGKTETQKILVGYIQNYKEIIVVEDTNDSHIKRLYPEKNIMSWLVVRNNKENQKLMTMAEAVREGVRHNPDWLIISETRGSEAADMLDAVKTDHALITTLHSKGAKNNPSRLKSMIRTAPSYQQMNDITVGKEIVEFFPIGIHLEYELDEETFEIVRFIREIVVFNDYTEFGAECTYLYKVGNDYNINTQAYEPIEEIGKIPNFLLQQFKNKRLYHLVPKIFISEEGGKANEKSKGNIQKFAVNV